MGLNLYVWNVKRHVQEHFFMAMSFIGRVLYVHAVSRSHTGVVFLCQIRGEGSMQSNGSRRIYTVKWEQRDLHSQLRREAFTVKSEQRYLHSQTRGEIDTVK